MQEWCWGQHTRWPSLKRFGHSLAASTFALPNTRPFAMPILHHDDDEGQEELNDWEEQENYMYKNNETIWYDMQDFDWDYDMFEEYLDEQD